MKTKYSFPVFILLLFSLVLAACQGATPTPETHEVPNIVEQKDEQEEPMVEEASTGVIISLVEDADLGSFLVD